LPDHLELLQGAIAAEAGAHRALLAGDEAAAELTEAARLYRASWEVAPPASYGRLIGMLKASVIAGDAAEAATYAREQIPAGAASPAAAYALAIAALVEADDAAAAAAAEGMRGASPAFDRTAKAIAAVAAGDPSAYASAVGEIVADFEGRDEHLTGVPIADTALMLERPAAARGMASRPRSPLLPTS
jgi:hypothetical protein